MSWEKTLVEKIIDKNFSTLNYIYFPCCREKINISGQLKKKCMQIYNIGSIPKLWLESYF